ncbi:MAG TPA: hypothetical protein DCR93_11385 [Cytophagales bacterium]|nr:hypothetical protein [Cytophagales bacterium]
MYPQLTAPGGLLQITSTTRTFSATFGGFRGYYRMSYPNGVWSGIPCRWSVILSPLGQMHHLQAMTTVDKLLSRRWLLNVLFWLGYAVIPFLINWGKFGSQANMLTDLQYYLECAALGYVHNLVLMPFFFDRKRYWQYVLLVLGSVVGLVFLSEIITTVLSPGYPANYLSRMYAGFDFAMFLVAFACGLILQRYFRQNQALKQAEALRLKTELDFLRAQINPHLLFNTLNTLYSHSLQGDPGTPQMILKLSELMRYMLYEAQEAQVLLDQEIQFLENYISLQQLRLGDRGQVTITLPEKNPMVWICPMLLIPLVENAFKYSMDTLDQAVSISIQGTLSGPHLQFKVSNNYQRLPKPPLATGGIGLHNTQQRLEKLYPHRHTLQVEDTGTLFTVHLSVTLDDQVPHH